MSARRHHINQRTKLAAALACLLPQMRRDELRRLKASADDVISLFEFDHIVLHALDGSDEWWNIDPKTLTAHREKSRRDTSIVAKTRRIEKRWNEFTAALAKGRKPPKRASRWSKRKFRRS